MLLRDSVSVSILLRSEKYLPSLNTGQPWLAAARAYVFVCSSSNRDPSGVKPSVIGSRGMLVSVVVHCHLFRAA